ncbi:MAG TPA: hypothetical protein VK850_05335 [Candidatus Binatia bacterium]|nr:hypothetical protein [Candidatus Binatia bacterium]
MKKLAVLVLAALPGFLCAQSDNFDDGNDAGWTRYDPIGIATFSFPNGAYRMQTPRTPNAAFGAARAGSLREDVTYTDFYITVDIPYSNTNLNQAFGILARVKEPGLGTTDGYAMTWNRGGGDLDISAIVNESPSSGGGHAVGVTGNDHATLVQGKTYRMVFIGKDTQLTGQIYELPNMRTPLASITGTDANFVSGFAGLVVYDNASSANQAGTDTTFDNYFALPFQPPRLNIEALDFGDIRITWPADPTNYVLQATSTLSVDWVDITENIQEGGGIRSFTDSADLQDKRFYRLRP